MQFKSKENDCRIHDSVHLLKQDTHYTTEIVDIQLPSTFSLHPILKVVLQILMAFSPYILLIFLKELLTEQLIVSTVVGLLSRITIIF